MLIQTNQFDKVELVHVNAVSGKIDIRTRLPAGAVAVTSDPHGNLWVSNYDRNTVSLFTGDGTLVKEVEVPLGPRFLAASPDAAWVLSQVDGSLSRVDLQTFEVRTIPLDVPGEGGFIAYGLGAVWVSAGDTPLIKVNAATYQVEERYTGVGGDCISTAFGSVWLSNRELGNVWRLSPGESP